MSTATWTSRGFEVGVLEPEYSAKQKLLDSARGGDREAAAQLLVPYASMLYARALRLTQRSADAEDVRQESLLKGLLRLGQFSGSQAAGHDDLQAWISRIAVNSSIDLIRRRREKRVVSLEEPTGAGEETIGGNIAAREQNPEELFAQRQRRLLFAAAIRGLAPELRQVCLLRDVLQYSTQEVADRLGISTVAVRLRLFRAHKRLREKLRQRRGPVQRVQASGNRKPVLCNLAKQERIERFVPLSPLPQCACGD